VEFEIEIGRDVAACEAAVALQRETWGDAVVVPSNMLLATVHAGGFLALARVGGEPVGFVYSFCGVREGRLTHHSHMLAVRPAHRGSEIARRLKCAQREHCLAHGIDLVTWTMDPLESRNGRFNLAKLGAVGAEYHTDFYGEMPDRLNAGLPSDRFMMEWHLRSPRVLERVTDRAAVPSLAATERSVPYALAAEKDRPGAERPVDESKSLVSVPWDFQSIKARDIGLAMAWREAHRRTLGAALARGYAATELLIDDHRAAYLVERDPTR
jgi:predicted GNAT superfamily acetyltransferase